MKQEGSVQKDRGMGRQERAERGREKQTIVAKKSECGGETRQDQE